MESPSTAPLAPVADRFIIASRKAAGRILCSSRRCQDVAWMVSIGGAAEPPPAGFRNVSARLRLSFEDDCRTGFGGPDLHDMLRMIDFFRGLDLRRGLLLLQCEAGVSRSSAAAVIWGRVDRGAGGDVLAVANVKRVCPEAQPNREMLRLADEILDSQLVSAWDQTSVLR